MRLIYLLTGIFLLFWCILPYFYGTYHIGTWIGILCGLFYAGGFFLCRYAFYVILSLVLTVYLLQISIRMILACFHRPKGEETLLVLGAHFTSARPSTIMKERMEKAMQYLHAHPQAEAVLSGGQTSDEPCPEAQEMERILKEKGIAPERLIKEEKSETTAENMQFSAALVKGKAAVCTNEFHMYRALKLAREYGIEAAAVPCHTVFRYLGIYWFREIAALHVKQ